MMFLNLLKREVNKAFTVNGAVTYATTTSDCLDLFATSGALRNASDDEILARFIRAFAEDRDIAMKTLFYTRDIRGGLGERRFFRVVIKYLAKNYPETVIKNIDNIAEYGRYDDILALMDTACEQEAIAYIKAVLEDDMENMQAQGSVSLMAKWLPSVNASSKETVRIAKKIARAMNMSDASYRKMLSSLRAYIKILENNLRLKDYSFEYEKQPSKALFKYRKAFIRNDEERYSAFIEKAKADPSALKTSTLTPYDIVSKIIRLRRSAYGFKPGYAEMSQDERNVLDATWNALENYVNSDNTLAVVDGSGSMYGGRGVLPAAVAESLGMYPGELASCEGKVT